jgi:hypothetical protein
MKKKERDIEGKEVIYGKIFGIDVTNSHNAVYKSDVMNKKIVTTLD